MAAVLTNDEYFEVRTWALNNRERIETENKKYDQWARIAKKDTGVKQVSECNIKKIFRDCDIKAKVQNGNTPIVQIWNDLKAKDQRIKELEDRLDYLYSQLGEKKEVASV